MTLKYNVIISKCILKLIVKQMISFAHLISCHEEVVPIILSINRKGEVRSCSSVRFFKFYIFYIKLDLHFLYKIRQIYFKFLRYIILVKILQIIYYNINKISTSNLI